MKTEFEVKSDFTNILGLVNQTDGTLIIYDKPCRGHYAVKPDGYYYADGVTFILDAKAENKKSTNQLFDYMKFEKNPNYIGFFYSYKEFKCYVRGELISDETKPQNYEYYVKKYFPNKITNHKIVNESAKKLANLFRDANINKQMNVPFIGAVMLCLKFKKNFINNTTFGILNLIRQNIDNVIPNTPLNRREKKEFLKHILGDSTLKKASFCDLLNICREISCV